MTQPNFFIVGSPKAGTSAMAQYLSEHPNVFFSMPKEPFYWCHDFQESKSIHGLDSLEKYLSLFSTADPSHHHAIGEGSTTYLQSKVAAQGIRDFNADAKVIAMLRSPVEVVAALHGELLRHGFEDQEQLDLAWAMQADRAQGRNIPKNCQAPNQLQYQDVASYADQVERLMAVFPESHRKIVIFDDFVANPGKEYRSTLQFLGVVDDRREEFPKVHSAKVVRNRMIARLQNNPPAWLEGATGKLKSWYYGSSSPVKKILQSLLTRQQSRAPMDGLFRRQLANEFRSDVEKLSQLIGRDLSHWVAEPIEE